MKNVTLILFSAITIIFMACGGGEKKQSAKERILANTVKDPYQNWKDYNGVGPVQAFELPAEIDNSMVTKGQEVFEAKCTACHKPEKRFIGPAPKDILSRRNPAWVMNMILDPEQMVKEDAIAKKLLIDFNGSPMANQNLTEEEARAVLEYFRTL